MFRTLFERTGRLLFAGCCCATLPAAVQTSTDRTTYAVRSWSAADGLPSSGITDLAITRTGHLWVSTFSGVGRFDGSEFRVHEIADTPGLVSNRALCLMEDHGGQIWIGTEEAGVSLYDQTQHSFYGLGEDSGLGPGMRVHDLAQDSTGAVWAATGKQLLRWDGQGAPRFVPVEGEGAPVVISAVEAGRQGEMWCAGEDGLFLNSLGIWESVPLPPSVELGFVQELAFTSHGVWVAAGEVFLHCDGARIERVDLPFSGDIHGVVEAKNGDLWLAATNSPLLHWPRGASEPVPIEGWEPRRSRNPIPVGVDAESLLMGPEGTLWVGTPQDLQRVRLSSELETIFLPGPEPQAWTAVRDDAGYFWMGQKSTLLRWSPKERHFDRFFDPLSEQPLPSDVYGLYHDRSGRIWAGLADGVVTLSASDPTSWAHAPLLEGEVVSGVRAFHEDPDGSIWVGAESALFHLGETLTTYPVGEQIAPGQVRCMVRGPDHGLWVGSDGGLAVLSTTGGVDRYTSQELAGLPPGGIRAFHLDSEEILWIGSYGGGLGRYKDGTFARFSVARNHMPENTISGIYECGERMWFYGNLGVHHIARKELLADLGSSGWLRFQSLGPYDGVDEGNGGFCPAGFVDGDEVLYVPTRRGLVGISTDMESIERIAPQAFIDVLEFGSERVTSNGFGDLGPGGDDLRIRYSAVSLSDPESLNFRYRLEGYDDDWVHVGRRREAYYTHVPPGRYTFRVSTSRAGGEWVADRVSPSLSFRVQPYFFAKPLFYVPLLLLLAFLALLGLRSWSRSRRAEVMRREQARRMEALGALAGGIAHDLNNVLTPIFGYTELTRERLPAQATERAMLDNVLRAAERARKLVEGVLNFGRRRPRLTQVRLEELIEETITLLAPGKEGIEFETTVDPRVGPVLGDPTQLHQVIYNLCTNAAQVLEPGGRIEVSLSQAHFDRGVVEGLGPVVAGKYACLMVRDDGPGMPAAVLSRVFEPFFTTKEPGLGTGMGLAVVHGIVSAHDGYISVESKVGRGSTFRAYLPLATEESEEVRGVSVTLPPEPSFASDSQPTPAPNARNAHLLIVDDEPVLVNVVRSMLARRGFRVSGFSDPEEALESVRDTVPPYNLAILDQNMPGMTGLELAARLHDEVPDLPIVLMTGMPQALSPQDRLSPHVAYIVYKPFTDTDITRVVQELIEKETRDQPTG